MAKNATHDNIIEQIKQKLIAASPDKMQEPEFTFKDQTLMNTKDSGKMIRKEKLPKFRQLNKKKVKK